MKGPTDPQFLGNMHENITYYMGPGFGPPRENWYVATIHRDNLILMSFLDTRIEM